MKRRYLVVFEKGTNNYGAFVPDLPGCVCLGETLEETRRLMHEGLVIHLESMIEDGETIPQAYTSNFDFSGDTPENGVQQCIVEWMDVEVTDVAVDLPPATVAAD